MTHRIGHIMIHGAVHSVEHIWEHLHHSIQPAKDQLLASKLYQKIRKISRSKLMNQKLYSSSHSLDSIPVKSLRRMTLEDQQETKMQIQALIDRLKQLEATTGMSTAALLLDLRVGQIMTSERHPISRFQTPHTEIGSW